jgi:hypothetical protein
MGFSFSFWKQDGLRGNARSAACNGFVSGLNYHSEDFPCCESAGMKRQRWNGRQAPV